MKEDNRAAADRAAKIIPIQWDATFFFERAVRSMDRFHYDKALKYFRRAVEYEPENPVNHCNLAGILSEMGQYEESNRILVEILETLEPDLTECFFYMANNFANMEQYEKAEQALLRYLEEDEEGHYLDEAEEMMELLHYELKRPAKVVTIKARQGYAEHDRARALLEEGKFSQAVKLLESIVEQNGEFMAARNNLALAYYYMGRFDTAMETIREALEQEEGNLHALCNLAIFYQHANDTENLAPLTDQLRRTVPFHQEHVFKLATTMGILGEHECALGHFRRLLKDGSGEREASLYHYAAVAAVHSNRFGEAEQLWQQAVRRDPKSDVARYYLEQLALVKKGQGKMAASYHYHLPFEEQFRMWERMPGTMPDGMKSNPLVRSSFFWALRHGDRKTKLQVIQALGLIADSEVKEALQALLLEPDEDDDLKRLALFVLRSIGVAEPLPAVLEGERRLLGSLTDSDPAAGKLPGWEPGWQSVLDKAFSCMGSEYGLLQQYDLMKLWLDFLGRVYPNVPKLAKPESWSAALEYLTAKLHRRTVSYQEVAERYGASAATVSKYAKRIDEICGVMKK
ncbi:tetratricopeptide repeat protein [Paenibacillus pasadenensis]|uniref:tetratricopeptide repeat protein n=1 Tax=Paenibacillus pasadenensis TaxID=217090 RepID=UPI00203FCF5C|nr:tetratricopeptide repeat protein [Paenibacillus pasadenensis]